MRGWSKLVSGITLASFFSAPATCQTPAPGAASPQVLKEWALGRRVAQDLEDRDGRIDDAAIAEYLQRVERRLTNTAGGAPLEIRVTRSLDDYASILPGRVLCIAGGLLGRLEGEAELAGLLAHELAHTTRNASAGSPEPLAPVVSMGACVLASPSAPTGWSERMREPESQAMVAAVGYLKAAGYDPLGALELLSKLAYDHPSWARAFAAEDLLHLRATVEADTVPPAGLITDASEFRQFHARLMVALGRRERPARRPDVARPTLQRP